MKTRIQSVWSRIGMMLVAASSMVLPSCSMGAEIKPKHRGHVVVSAAAQRLNDDSIFAPDFLQGDVADSFSIVNQRLQANYTVNKFGSYSFVFDGQHDQNRFADNQSRINQLYVGLDLTRNWKIKFGRQRVSWGKGFTYIATDFINPPLDPVGLDPAKIGVDAISLDYVDQHYSVTAVATSEQGGIDSGGFKIASSALSGIDLDAVLYRSPSVGTAFGGSFSLDAGQVIHDSLFNLVIFGSVSNHEKSRYPELQRVDQSSVVVPGDLGRDGSFNSGLLGFTYQATNTMSITGEHYWIGDAYTRREYDQIIQPLSNFDDPTREGHFGWLDVFSVGYGRVQEEYTSLSLSLAPLTTIGNRFSDNLNLDLGMLRADDDSYLITFAATSTYWGRAELAWRTTWVGGPDASEFATAPFKWYSEISVKFGF